MAVLATVLAAAGFLTIGHLIFRDLTPAGRRHNEGGGIE